MIRLLILDVDGVMTPGELPYGDGGNVEKCFHVQDGSAIKLWMNGGGRVAIISGRKSPAVNRRAADLGITFVAQGVTNKTIPFEKACSELQAEPAETAVIGDDLLDLPILTRCGYPIAVANAVPTVKRAARYVTRRTGGAGAINEAVERLLRHNGTWEQAIRKYLA